MRAVLLFSGGIDSTTALTYYHNLGYELTCVTFNYAQKNQFEIEVTKSIAMLHKISEHLVINIDSQIFNGTSSLNSDKEVEKFDSYIPNKNFIPTTYVPSRNTIFLSFAAAIAESRKIYNIIFSPNKNDAIDYPDCSLDFVKTFNRAINKGTQTGKKKGFKILTPFIDKTKSEIIELGLSLNIDYSKTQTCYNPNNIGQPCFHCDACLLREFSFKKLGLHDPLLK